MPTKLFPGHFLDIILLFSINNELYNEVYTANYGSAYLSNFFISPRQGEPFRPSFSAHRFCHNQANPSGA